KTCVFDIRYNEGISLSGDTLDTGVNYGVVKKSGNTYLYGEMKLGVGREVAKDYLKQNPKIIQEIKDAVWEKVRAGAKEEKKIL
ncbi:MAG: DNA recombination/repair protein RecA, partial [Candidatus Parcubacteria bacterium]|nr:DNA recombination/repair protein RecA [Candidatus Parcubacteria bacterium]